MRRGLRRIQRRLLAPQALDARARLLLRIGGVFRWAVIGMVGLCAVVQVQPQPLPGCIVPWMAAVGLYAAVLPAASERLSPGGAANLTRAIALADLLSLLALLGVYRGDPPDGFYIAAALMLLEATLIGGSRGAVAVGAVLALAMGPLNFLSTLLFRGDRSWTQMATDASSVALLAIAFAMSGAMLGAEAARSAPPVAQAGEAPEAGVTPASEDTSAVHLTNREREVLSLMARGYSNLMIAARLRVTESTVKGHVESIFARLNARNRAEAVAVAARLRLFPGGALPSLAEHVADTVAH